MEDKYVIICITVSYFLCIIVTALLTNRMDKLEYKINNLKSEIKELKEFINTIKLTKHEHNGSEGCYFFLR